MAKKTFRVAPKELGGAVRQALDERGEELSEAVEGAVDGATRDLAEDVADRASRLFGGTGEYAAGWTCSVNRNGLSSVGVAYNGGPAHSLAHLLEYGHELYVNSGRPPGNHPVHAGRVQGREHIAPAFEDATEGLVSRIEREL